MDVNCRIELLGGLRLLQGEQVHSHFRTHKVASLLSYLAFYNQKVHSREALVDCFWPDMDIENGRNNLSTALSHLRSRLEPPGVPAGTILISDRFSVRLNPMAVSTDVADFRRLSDIAKVSETAEYRISSRKRAIALYRDVLLPGFSDEWVIEEQTELERLLAETLHGLCRDLEEADRLAEAIEVAQRATRIDPYDQQAYQAQMRLYAGLGRTSAALKTYQKAEQFLRKEMGVSLSAATRELAAMIENNPRAFVSGAKTGTRVSLKPSPIQFARKETSKVENDLPCLPLQLTPCFGRDQERESLHQSLRDPTTRLLTLLGPGGVGKTRLAIEVAQNIAPVFANRVWFIELANLSHTNLIPASLASALNLSAPSSDTLECVVDHLGEWPCLLVLDNFEHLLRGTGAENVLRTGTNSAAAFTRLLLERIPGLVCLATSQTALNIAGEIKVPINPFPVLTPEEVVDVETARRNHAVQLFEQFRQAKYPFRITDENLSHVAQICRFTDGIPLFLQLAAQRREKLPAIAESMTRFFEVDGEESVRPAFRHQTEWDCIIWSHSLLTPSAKVLLRRLSVLAGEWEIDISRTICGMGMGAAYPTLLEELCDCSLVQWDKNREKYRILEPVRAFALGQLKNSEDALSVTERLDLWLEQEDSLRDLTLVGAQEIRNKERIEAAVALGDNVLGLQKTSSLAELRIQVKTAGGRIALGTIKGASRVLPAISAFVNKGISLEDHMNIHLK